MKHTFTLTLEEINQIKQGCVHINYKRIYDTYKLILDKTYFTFGANTDFTDVDITDFVEMILKKIHYEWIVTDCKEINWYIDYIDCNNVFFRIDFKMLRNNSAYRRYFAIKRDRINYDSKYFYCGNEYR